MDGLTETNEQCGWLDPPNPPTPNPAKVIWHDCDSPSPGETRVFGGFHFGLQSKSQVRRRGRCEHQQNQRKLRIFNRTVACIYEPQTDALPAELRSPQMPLEHQMSREG
jgi:hypothetical protein